MAELKKRIQSFLDGHSTLTLAVAGPDGPWAADVYFVRSGWRLYFFSRPGSRHIAGLGEGGRAAGAVHGETAHWRQIRGVQLEGRVDEVVELVEKAGAMALFPVKFPFFAELDLGTLMGKGRQNRLYRFSPSFVRWVDNSRGFGHKEELIISENEA